MVQRTVELYAERKEQLNDDDEWVVEIKDLQGNFTTWGLSVFNSANAARTAVIREWSDPKWCLQLDDFREASDP